MTRAMVLAAGRGERMRPLTDTMPKPLLEIGGRALIEHHLTRLVAAGIRSIVINLSWHGAAIRERLGDGSGVGASIRYVDEGPEPLETAGGIVNALPLLGDAPFVVVNGDIWTGYPFERLALPTGRLAHLVLVPNPAHNPEGDFTLREDGDVRCIDAESRHEGAAPTVTFSGLGIYSPALFAGLEAGIRPLAPVLLDAAARGTVSGEPWDGEWDDVGTPERLEALRERM